MDDLSTKKLDPDYVDGNTKEAVYKVARSYGVTEFRVPDGTEVRQGGGRRGATRLSSARTVTGLKSSASSSVLLYRRWTCRR